MSVLIRRPCGINRKLERIEYCPARNQRTLDFAFIPAYELPDKGREKTQEYRLSDIFQQFPTSFQPPDNFQLISRIRRQYLGGYKEDIGRYHLSTSPIADRLQFALCSWYDLDSGLLSLIHRPFVGPEAVFILYSDKNKYMRKTKSGVAGLNPPRTQKAPIFVPGI